MPFSNEPKDPNGDNTPYWPMHFKVHVVLSSSDNRLHRKVRRSVTMQEEIPNQYSPASLRDRENGKVVKDIKLGAIDKQEHLDQMTEAISAIKASEEGPSEGLCFTYARDVASAIHKLKLIPTFTSELFNEVEKLLEDQQKEFQDFYRNPNQETSRIWGGKGGTPWCWKDSPPPPPGPPPSSSRPVDL